MNKIIASLIIAGMVSLSCGKKDDTSITKDVKPNDNKQQQNQQQNNQQQNNNQTSSKSVSYKVTAVDKQAKAGQMIDFTWTQDGKEKKLSDYKGKVILLNFWATWCPPCKKELPDLSKISTELKDKDFVMIGVSVDDDQEILNSYLRSNGLPYTVVFEPTELVGKYMTTTGQTQNVVPQTYIIDKNGKVVEAILGARSKADFLEIINKYL
jgi:cytochrome c-type biogenesis protein